MLRQHRFSFRDICVSVCHLDAFSNNIGRATRDLPYVPCGGSRVIPYYRRAPPLLYPTFTTCFTRSEQAVTIIGRFRSSKILFAPFHSRELLSASVNLRGCSAAIAPLQRFCLISFQGLMKRSQVEINCETETRKKTSGSRLIFRWSRSLLDSCFLFNFKLVFLIGVIFLEC